MLAVMLLYKTVSFQMAHDEGRMKDPVVLHERAKVRYVADAELTAALPVRVAIVEVTLRNGKRYSERVDAVRGTPRNPMSRDEVVAKARDLIEPVLQATGSKLIDRLLALESVADIRELRPLLAYS
jgi:2-methylcitrate dehydratase PrpD